MSDVKALDPALLKQYSTDFNADRANLVAANAAVSSGVLAAATDYKGERVLQNDFSIELKQGSITNQRSSGRCWMFAALNTLRYELMHRWDFGGFRVFGNLPVFLGCDGEVEHVFGECACHVG